MFKIGDFEIHLVNDARIMGDWGGPFGLVPRALWSKYKQVDEMGRIAMDHHCLLVRAGGKNIVVDTGIGTKIEQRYADFVSLTRPNGTLIDGLAKLGVKPADVDLVINTHLHSDHCGGNTCFDPGGKVIPTFPRAEYWVQRLECADASFPNERTRGTYFAFNFEPLMESGQLKLLDGETEVVSGMRTVVTPGHTRAHQSVLFESGGQYGMYVCDLASFAVHFAKLGWMTAYDVEPLITLETKRIWQKWALKHDATLIFIHDADTPVCHAVGSAEKLEVVPVEFDWQD